MYQYHVDSLEPVGEHGSNGEHNTLNDPHRPGPRNLPNGFGTTSYTWSTPSNSTVISVTPTVETVYSVSGTGANGCVGVATATVSVSCAAVAPAQASPPTVVGVLSAGNCPISITTQATGNSFVFTGADGFVFSNVYRRVGTYPVTVSGIKQPGTFTLTSNSTNACGQTTTQVISFVVTGVGCP